DVVDRLLVDVVDDRELLVGVGLRGLLGRVGEQEADGDDQVAVLLYELGDIRHEVGIATRLQHRGLDPEFLFGLLDPLPRCLVERPVVDTAGVGHHAGAEVFTRLLTTVSAPRAGFGRGCTTSGGQQCERSEEPGHQRSLPAHNASLCAPPGTAAGLWRANTRPFRLITHQPNRARYVPVISTLPSRPRLPRPPSGRPRQPACE